MTIPGSSLKVRVGKVVIDEGRTIKMLQKWGGVVVATREHFARVNCWGGLVKPWTEEDRRKGFDATVGVVEIPDDRSRKTPTSPHRSSRISPKCSSFPRTHRRDVTPPTPPYFHHASFPRGVLGA